jgi:hypothetical protein
MTAQIHHFGTDPDTRAERRIAVAHRLVEMTLEAAEAVQRLALAQIEQAIAAPHLAPAPAAPRGRPADPMAAVERAGRSVRLSLALAARLDGEEPLRQARARNEAEALREAQAEDRRREADAARAAERMAEDALEARVFEVVEATLEASGMDAETLETRVAEISERMHEGEWEYDYVRRPIGAVIATICADLEIDPDWSLWADTDWAVEEARTAATGSPYAPGGAAWGGGAAASGPAEAAVREPVAADGASP